MDVLPLAVASFFLLQLLACYTCNPLNDPSNVHFPRARDIDGTDQRSKRAVSGEKWECEGSFESYDEDCPNGAVGLSPCQPGRLKISECIGADGDTSQICDPCPQKFYQSSYNRCTSCHECSECGANERIKVQCTDETDTVCESIIDPGTTPEPSTPPSTTSHGQASSPRTTTFSSTTQNTSTSTTDIATSDGSQGPPEKTDVGTDDVTNTSGANIPVASKSANKNMTVIAIIGWILALVTIACWICTSIYKRGKSGRTRTRKDGECVEMEPMHNSDSGENPSHPQTNSRCTENGEAIVSLPEQTQTIVHSPEDDVENYSLGQKLLRSLSRFVVHDGAKKNEVRSKIPLTDRRNRSSMTQGQMTKGRGIKQSFKMTDEPEPKKTQDDSHKRIDTEIMNDAENHGNKIFPTSEVSAHTTCADMHSVVNSQRSTHETGTANPQPPNAENGLEQQAWRAEKVPASTRNLDTMDMNSQPGLQRDGIEQSLGSKSAPGDKDLYSHPVRPESGHWIAKKIPASDHSDGPLQERGDGDGQSLIIDGSPAAPEPEESEEPSSPGRGSGGNCSAGEATVRVKELHSLENSVCDVQTDSPSSTRRTLGSPESPHTLSSGTSTEAVLACVENGNGGEGQATVIDHSRPGGPARANLMQHKERMVIPKLETGSTDDVKPVDPEHYADPLLPNGVMPEIRPTQIGASEESETKSKISAIFGLMHLKWKKKKRADLPEEPQQSEPFLSNGETMVTEKALEYVAEKIPLKTRDKLCRGLGLTATEVDNLKYELGQNHSGSELAFYMLLNVRKKQGQKLTYRNLIVALRASKNSDIADNVISQFNLHHSSRSVPA